MSDDHADRILSAIAALRGDLMARMDRLQGAIGAIRNDIVTNYGAADRAMQVNDHTREELRALGGIVSLMQKPIQRRNAKVFGGE